MLTDLHEEAFTYFYTKTCNQKALEVKVRVKGALNMYFTFSTGANRSE